MFEKRVIIHYFSGRKITKNFYGKEFYRWTSCVNWSKVAWFEIINL